MAAQRAPVPHSFAVLGDRRDAVAVEREPRLRQLEMLLRDVHALFGHADALVVHQRRIEGLVDAQRERLSGALELQP